jgi:hypothetical protein
MLSPDGGAAVLRSRSCRSDSPLASPAVLRSELHIPGEIRAPLKIEVIDHLVIGRASQQRPKDFCSLRELGYFYS